MSEEVDRCHSCGKELKEEDGNKYEYEFWDGIDEQCIKLCKECRTRLKEPPEIIEIRDISFEQAKKEISEHYENLKEGAAYPSDVSLILKLDSEQTKKAVEELIKEGKMETEEELRPIGTDFGIIIPADETSNSAKRHVIKYRVVAHKRAFEDKYDKIGHLAEVLETIEIKEAGDD